jgi:hypothetical protein
MRSKKVVYVVATFVAVFLFVLFRDYGWSLYLGVCAGYTILVFGLRRIQQKRELNPGANVLPLSRVLLVHSTFLVIVIGWVWLLRAVGPSLPYILRTEDSSRPYFGLVFLGVLTLLLLELYEQRHLRGNAESGLPSSNNHNVNT